MVPLAIAAIDTQGCPRSNWAAPPFHHSPPPPILKPDPQPTSDHKARTALKIGSQPPHSPATRYFHGAVWITELSVISQSLFRGHLRDSAGARAYMAGIYENQEVIKVLVLKETEERHDSPTSTCYRQAKGWLAFAMKSSKSQIFGIVFKQTEAIPPWLHWTLPHTEQTLEKVFCQELFRTRAGVLQDQLSSSAGSSVAGLGGA